MGEILGLIKIAVGIEESRVAYAYDAVLYSVFHPVEALYAYSDYPRHLEVQRDLKDMRIARHQVDYRMKIMPSNDGARTGPERRLTAAMWTREEKKNGNGSRKQDRAHHGGRDRDR